MKCLVPNILNHIYWKLGESILPDKMTKVLNKKFKFNLNLCMNGINFMNCLKASL